MSIATVQGVIGLELRALRVPGLTEPLTVTVELDEVVALVLPHPVATALADVVTGIAEPAGGDVLVDGSPLAAPRPGVPSPVALVPPDGGLLPHLTVKANILYGRCVAEGMREDQLRGQLRTAATQLSLLDVLDSRPHELTAGRRLRVGLARALLRSPLALVLEDRADRPSWAAQLTPRDALDGTAVLVITDDRTRVIGFADTVLEVA
ncbi:hypothetical protein Lesp02_62570 [Lentzea sp. NBRC 105346]|uniref:ATP-binding cassette domain-containing protein n=1 Tax=Lentzea sp. NBRC 105346 TaxID=3032205 RepID=UPI00255658BF|nr:ATP-binding cassette domain-containing protein [Lentzea sp. NBRC 105346]GLZ34070.1 hypothetical protein Lesp02_62570 [Lentzea sp. NBRC 105346]